MISAWVRGLSDRDVEALLAEALGPGAAMSKSTASRICSGCEPSWRSSAPGISPTSSWTTCSTASARRGLSGGAKHDPPCHFRATSTGTRRSRRVNGGHTKSPVASTFGNRCSYGKVAELPSHGRGHWLSPTENVLVRSDEDAPGASLLLSVPRASHARPPNYPAPAVTRDDVTPWRAPAGSRAFVMHDYERPAEARLGELAGPPHERSNGRRQPYART